MEPIGEHCPQAGDGLGPITHKWADGLGPYSPLGWDVMAPKSAQLLKQAPNLRHVSRHNSINGITQVFKTEHIFKSLAEPAPTGEVSLSYSPTNRGVCSGKSKPMAQIPALPRKLSCKKLC